MGKKIIKKAGVIALCSVLCMGGISHYPATEAYAANNYYLQEKTVEEKKALKPITNLKTATGDYEFKISWDSPYSDYKVSLERSIGDDKHFTKYATIDVEDESYTYYDYDVKKGIPYYYRLSVISYSQTEEYEIDDGNDLGDYSSYSRGYQESYYVTHSGRSPYVYSKKTMISIPSPGITKIEATDNRSIKLYWPDAQDADGYRIYRRKGNSGEFTCIATMKSTAYINRDYFDGYYGYHIYTDKNLKLGATYYYKLCAFKKNGNKKYDNKLSKIKKATVTINGTKISGAASKNEGSNTITWKKVGNANGYYIYYATNEKGKYKKIATIKNKNKTSYTHKGLTNGKLYYYKVVPYRKVKGTILCGNSTVYKKYVDYYAYKNESYYLKCKRIFGTDHRIEYSSEAEAMAHMKTIEIKVWDINSSGAWYTRTYSLTTHENIAPTVKKMFEELYASKNPTPIHDIGCFSFRGGEHSLGLAIDINPDENYMIDGNEIQCGSFWDPSRSKYSIPMNCDLVRIFEKYGFRRGFWGNRKDYMHFSYFGT